MTNKNFDGIRKLKSKQPIKVLVVSQTKFLKVDGLIGRQIIKTERKVKRIPTSVIAQPQLLPKVRQSRIIFFRNLYSQQKVPVLAAVAALFLAFAFGGWFALNTTRSQADTTSQTPAVLGEQTQTPAGSVVLPGLAMPGQSDSATNSDLFNTPIEYLKNYFDSINQPDVIAQRKNQLEQFLKDMHSPLVPAAETIAQQSHWQLILAIAFAESTLGKNCADYNCSNIGVGPTSPYWHKYDSYNAWVLDFNRLLDKKYNNWTLKQMCGVYVKPCNPNWLMATQEILDALKDRGVE